MGWERNLAETGEGMERKIRWRKRLNSQQALGRSLAMCTSHGPLCAAKRDPEVQQLKTQRLGMVPPGDRETQITLKSPKKGMEGLEGSS